MSQIVIGIALVALVLLVSSLGSGIVERAPISFPIIFLALGVVLAQTNLLRIDTHDPLLELVAIVSLALVLFLDAVKLQIDEIRHDWVVPILSLGPGTLLTIGGIALTSTLLLRTTMLQSLLLGAILASTDPVVLRDVLRDPRIPRSVRRALGVEAGLNDLVVLPIVLVLIALLQTEVGGALNWVAFLAKLLILSPLVGLAVGGIGSWLMNLADRRFTIRREYQALYGIGLVLAAFAAGQAVQGDGFLAAFFAGLAVTLFNVSLCDCFMEYGETTSEMMMLLAFVLFGSVLATLLPTIALLPALALGVIAIGLIRPGVMSLVFARANMSTAARLFIGWFGPRGLNSMLLALLVVQAGVADADWLLGVTGAVVVLSVVAHGATATPLSKRYGQHVAATTLAEEREGTVTGLFQEDPNDLARISPAELAALLASPNPPIVLDVRSRSGYEASDGQIPSSVRVPPDQAEAWANSKHPEQAIVTYCNCPQDKTAARVARTLNENGLQASVLRGGYNAWQAEFPVEPKGTQTQVLVTAGER